MKNKKNSKTNSIYQKGPLYSFALYYWKNAACVH